MYGHQAEIHEQTQAERGIRRDQQLGELVADALVADLGERARLPRDGGGGALGSISKPSCAAKRHGAQHAQRIFVEAPLRVVAHGANQPRSRSSRPP